MSVYFLSFRKLIVWKEAQNLSMMIYDVTKSFPFDEKYGLVSQMRRASVSIQTNIAEGNESMKCKDRVHFFVMSKSSLVEVYNFVEFSYQRGLFSKEIYLKLISQLNRTAYLLRKFMVVQEKKVGNRSLSSVSSSSLVS